MKRTAILAITVAAAVSVLPITVQNQAPRRVTGVVESAGRPVAGALVEYEEDGEVGVETTTTDERGYFEFESGQQGIVTASKSGLAAISVLWPPWNAMPDLRIELPRSAALEGSLYDMMTRQTILEGKVSVSVDHDASPMSDTVFLEDGRFSFEDLPPGNGVLLVHAAGFAPHRGVLRLDAGEAQEMRIGLLLEGVVSGSVVDAEGEVVPEATVYVIYDAEFEDGELLESFLGGHMHTGDEGVFRVNGIVPDTPFSIYAETEDGRRSDTMTLEVVPGIPIENVILRIR